MKIVKGEEYNDNNAQNKVDIPKNKPTKCEVNFVDFLK